MSVWIKCEDRMPSLNEEVLILYKDKADELSQNNLFYGLAKRYIHKPFPSSKGWEDWSSFTEYQNHYEVVYWTPLIDMPRIDMLGIDKESEVYINIAHEVTEKDNLAIKEARRQLKKCPICGANAFISNDIVDGFYFGWSVGCPRFRLNDGIHGIDENTPTEKHLSIMNLDSATECVERWNKKVDNYLKESDKNDT